MAWQKTTISQFLTPRKERFKANDPAIAGIPRIEKIEFSGNIIVSQKPSKTDMILIHPGDFVISGINVAKGAMAVYQGTKPVKATIHYSSYTVNHEVINMEYFKRFLKSSVFVQLLKEQVPGGIKTEIKPKHLMPLVIDLPELPEQEAILSKFLNTEEEYVGLTDEIANQKKLLKKYRQAILQEAIEGKLTADWRAVNPDVEPASELLKRITTEKAELVKQKKISKPKPLPPIKPEDVPFDIPDTWHWCRLQMLVDEQRGITYGIVKMGKEPKSNGIYALRCSDVKLRQLDLSKVRTVSAEIDNQYTRTRLNGREVLLNVRGTLGGCAVVPPSVAGYNIAREVSLIPLHNDLFAEYIVDLLASPFFTSQVNANLKGIAYKGLNLNLLRTFLIPLPPLVEQKEITHRVQAKFALCDSLEAEIVTAEQNAQTLSAAILQEVFDHTEGIG